MSPSDHQASPPAAPEGSADRRHRRFELLFVFVLPLICFLADPFVFGVSSFAPLALWTFAALSTAAFALSSRRWEQGQWRDVLFGMIGTAIIGSASIAALLVPLCLLGFFLGLLMWSKGGALFFLAGFLGLTPLGTTLAFAHRFQKMADAPGRRRWALAGLGALLIIGLPATIQAAESRWLSPQLDQFRSPDTHVVLTALRRVENYPFWLGRGTGHLCHRLLAQKPPDPDLYAELRRIFDAEPVRHCEFWY